MNANKKEYIGDSVYVAFDGYDLILTTENGYGPTNTIVMEPEVMKKFARFVAVTHPKLFNENAR